MFQMPDQWQRTPKIPVNQAEFARFAHRPHELHKFRAFRTKVHPYLVD